MDSKNKRRNYDPTTKVDIGQNTKRKRQKIRQALRHYNFDPEQELEDEIYEDEYLKKTLNQKEN